MLKAAAESGSLTVGVTNPVIERGGVCRGDPRPASDPRAAAAPAEPLQTHFVVVADQKEVKQEDVMGRGLLLWLLGIPLPIIILIWVLGGLHG
jgi:hypothetical protein